MDNGQLSLKELADLFSLLILEVIASLSVLGVLTLTADDAAAQQVLERYKTRMAKYQSQR